MTQESNLPTQTITPILVKKMLTGGGIALILMLIFLLPIRDPNPAWGKLWIIKPLIVISLAGAMGGVFYYLMGNMRSQGGWKMILANVLCLLVYIFVLWIGTVLGLNGTLWD
jgi:hypothetical protein